MIVTVDGARISTEAAQMKTMADLVEYVKASIDPEKIIVSMALDGKELSEADWRVPLNALSKKALDFSTGSKEEYVGDRLKLASDYVEKITSEFVGAGELYLTGEDDEANSLFGKAVEDLQAFVNWYLTILSVATGEGSESVSEFVVHIQKIHKTCESLLEQQLYQSWQILGQTIKEQLEGELDELAEFCRNFSKGHSPRTSVDGS